MFRCAQYERSFVHFTHSHLYYDRAQHVIGLTRYALQHPLALRLEGVRQRLTPLVSAGDYDGDDNVTHAGLFGEPIEAARDAPVRYVQRCVSLRKPLVAQEVLARLCYGHTHPLAYATLRVPLQCRVLRWNEQLEHVLAQRAWPRNGLAGVWLCQIQNNERVEVLGERTRFLSRDQYAMLYI